MWNQQNSGWGWPPNQFNQYNQYQQQQGMYYLQFFRNLRNKGWPLLLGNRKIRKEIDLKLLEFYFTCDTKIEFKLKIYILKQYIIKI